MSPYLQNCSFHLGNRIFAEKPKFRFGFGHDLAASEKNQKSRAIFHTVTVCIKLLILFRKLDFRPKCKIRIRFRSRFGVFSRFRRRSRFRFRRRPRPRIRETKKSLLKIGRPKNVQKRLVFSSKKKKNVLVVIDSLITVFQLSPKLLL